MLCMARFWEEFSEGSGHMYRVNCLMVCFHWGDMYKKYFIIHNFLLFTLVWGRKSICLLLEFHLYCVYHS